MTSAGTSVPDAWVVIGRLGRPHGIRGEITVEVRTDDPDERFAEGAVLHRESGPPLRVARQHWHNGTLLLTVDGIDDRNGAEALRGTVVHADTTDDPPLDDPDEFYDHQLVGLAVVLADGAPVGEVTGVLHPPGGDLLAVERGAEGELLVPFVREVVPSVDLAARRVTITPPDGLLEL
ncbi:MAG TPA: ribosome maturation factor RimM [Mycobacteriales bacterium]|nr:ribosome maturation factor RimM [Mycobacteriales bacterium]